MGQVGDLKIMIVLRSNIVSLLLDSKRARVNKSLVTFGCKSHMSNSRSGKRMANFSSQGPDTYSIADETCYHSERLRVPQAHRTRYLRPSFPSPKERHPPYLRHEDSIQEGNYCQERSRPHDWRAQDPSDVPRLPVLGWAEVQLPDLQRTFPRDRFQEWRRVVLAPAERAEVLRREGQILHCRTCFGAGALAQVQHCLPVCPIPIYSRQANPLIIMCYRE